MSFLYELQVQFQEARNDLLYEGDLFYKENLIDHVRVAYDQILFRFERSKKIELENYLYSAQSPVRIQLYKAACYYLAVAGHLPDVNAIRLTQGKTVWAADKERLTRHWENCRIDILLDSKAAARCFTREGKTCYIAITYFLKAQLDSFPHDCFRAAWSGLNALYNSLTDDRFEGEKLKKLSQYLDRHPPESALTYIRTLPKGFWDRLDWYSFIRYKGLDECKTDVFQSNLYQDREIYSHLGRCIISLYEQKERKTGETHEATVLQEQFEKRIKKKSKRLNEQLRFLTVQYCYMLRNRSFHADKPYPVFGLFDERENSVEVTLTKLLLYVIRNLMAELS